MGANPRAIRTIGVRVAIERIVSRGTMLDPEVVA